MALLAIDHLAVSADTQNRSVAVIKNVSLSVEAGSVVAFVGESGAGKSMFTRVIAHMLPDGFRVSEGTVRFDDQDLVAMSKPELRRLLGREIAFIPQEPMSALDPIMTIGRQFDEHLIHVGVKGKAERRRRAIEGLEAVHLPRAAELLSSYRHELSGGMCQRVLIAMAFASRPRLIIADEPTTALDVTIQARIIKLMADMRRREGTTLLFVTHDLRLAARIADQIVVLYAGRVAERGPTRAVFESPRHPYTRSLLLANPPISGPDRPLLVMPDRMPGLAALADMKGCAFAARCAVASPECSTTETLAPAAKEFHGTACLFPERTGRVEPGAAVVRSAISAGEFVLEAAGVMKTYERRVGMFAPPRRVQALKDVSFQLRAGEFLGVVGESGSGKSTLAKVLVGLEPSTGGRIAVAGADVGVSGRAARETRSRAIQMVFQDPQSALNPRRLVWRLVTQMLDVVEPGLANPERIARARELLTDMGLPADAAFRFPGQLSGGQKQRVNIARALCILPKVLVADEIVSGLDVSVQAQLLELLLTLREKRGFSMILISHDISVVRHLCDRVMVMRGGEVVESGPARRVLENPSHAYTKALLAAVPPEDPDAPWAAMEAADADSV